jgi:hypothetical protein
MGWRLSLLLHINDDVGAMPDEAIAAAHEQAVEQVMSDERLLGVLPDDLSKTLLDWVTTRIGQAAEHAPNVDAFWNEADAIRHRARTLADDSADAGDDATALMARLRSAEVVAGDEPSKPMEAERPTQTWEAGPAQVVQQAPASAPDSAPMVARDAPALPEPEPTPVLSPPPTSRGVEHSGESMIQPREPVAMPKRTRPNFIMTLRSSLRRTYGRFRAFLRSGGSH